MDAFGVVLGDILGSKADMLGNIFEGTQKTFDFRKLTRRAGERLGLEVRGGILGALGDLKNDVKWDQKSDRISGPELGG